MRQTALSASKDISRREVEKSSGFVEHLFHMIIQQRETLATFQRDHISLRETLTILEQLSSETGSCIQVLMIS